MLAGSDTVTTTKSIGPKDHRSRDWITVVKLGGSHAMQPHLPTWVNAIVRCAGRIVVVPGGGPFADAVRAAQPVMGFDDRAAHHMALLAMEQFGLALCGMKAALTLCASPEAIDLALARHQAVVWSPTSMVLADAVIPARWDVTSDSLAAWLAHRLRVRRLILVKHHTDLADQTLIDPSFDNFVNPTIDVCILSKHDSEHMIDLVGEG